MFLNQKEGKSFGQKHFIKIFEREGLKIDTQMMKETK
jgi:hypothetical protein